MIFEPYAEESVLIPDLNHVREVPLCRFPIRFFVSVLHFNLFFNLSKLDIICIYIRFNCKNEIHLRIQLQN